MQKSKKMQASCILQAKVMKKVQTLRAKVMEKSKHLVVS